jgi:hypothetical protein
MTHWDYYHAEERRILRHSPGNYDWLVERHPRLLAGKPVPQYRSFGDGWKHVIDILLRDIAELLTEEEMKAFRIEQLTQKFGRLKLSHWPPLPKIREVMELAKDRSALTCEACGGPGVIAEGGGHGFTACCAPCRAAREQGWTEFLVTFDKEERKQAIDEARCNVRLSGTILPPEVETINARYIEGEITSEQHTKAVLDYADALAAKGKR